MKPHNLHSLLLNNFVFPRNCREHLSSYFLLYWDGLYFIRNCKEGIVEKDGIKYLVIYHKATSRGKILANPSDKVALSFRNPKKEYNLPAYCLVTSYFPENENGACNEQV